MAERDEELYFGEEGFDDWMRDTAEPFLAGIRERGTLRAADGLELAYEGYHLEDATDCVVICHGFCEFAEKYYEVIYYFLKHGYSVYFLEHRGHGNSGREVDDLSMVYVKSFQQYVADFTKFVREVVRPREKRIYLFAHSMGGAIGALLLEQHPGLFRGAILSSPMCEMNAGKPPVPLAAAVSRLYCVMGKGKTYALGQSPFDGRETFEESCCLSRARFSRCLSLRLSNPKYRTSGGCYAWAYAGIYAGWKLMQEENAKKISVPVLLFSAENDTMVSNEAIYKFAGMVDGIRHVAMEGSKHEIFNADYDIRCKYYGEIFAFLDELAAREKEARGEAPAREQ